MSKRTLVAVASWAAGLLVAVLPLSAQNSAERGAGEAAEATAARQQPTTTIAVVDVDQAVQQCPSYIAQMKLFRERVETMRQELAQMASSQDELRLSIEALDPDSDDRANRMIRLELERDRLELTKKKYEYDNNVEQDRIRVIAYRELEAAIAKVAQRKGLDVVLSRQVLPSDSLERLSKREKAMLADLYGRQRVWFAAERLDITGDVIKQLQLGVGADGGKDKKPAEGAAPAGGTSGKEGQ